MRNLIVQFPDEVKDALQIAAQAQINVSGAAIRNVVITGLGGSGIGGSITAALLADELKVPVLVNKSYHLPAFANQNTLLLVSSYSGNTEETVSVMQQAIEKGVQIICVSSGGKVLGLAQAHNLSFIQIPAGRPPRASLGYSLVQQLAIFTRLGFCSDKWMEGMKQIPAFIQKHQAQIDEMSAEHAEQIKNSIPVLYSEDSLEPMMIRWKQQLNENSKMLCWHNVYPEMNHNELVGWRQSYTDLSLHLISTGDEITAVKKRMQLNMPIYEKYTSEIVKVQAQGNNKLEKWMWLLHYGDWLSLHLAEKRGYDPMEIDVLIKLKEDLAK